MQSIDHPQDAEFQPATSDPRLLRDALGRFATGVTVITCLTKDGPVGITANSFASVSLDPALVLWSIARSSSRFASFSAAQNFAIHILGADERDLAARFTRGGAGFEGLPLAAGHGGTPLIGGTLARFDCALDRALDGGDHLILLGRVLAASFRQGAPLVFSQGHFGGFAA
ncbi:flavin reductase family protein [Paragemmobacter straminiformis]|uniref:flavin reductase family protein n=1 Tax=Paragemmobacter straminiformis TaxID=2045119 RepID=UPI003BAEC52C